MPLTKMLNETDKGLTDVLRQYASVRPFYPFESGIIYRTDQILN